MSPRRVTLSTVGVLPGARAAGDRAAHAEPGDLAARDDRRAARPARADQPALRLARICWTPAGGFRCETAQPHHVRVRDARRGERHPGGRAPAGAAAATASRPRSTCCRSTKRRASRSHGRRTSGSIGSRRSWPIITSRCRCARPAAATSAPRADSSSPSRHGRRRGRGWRKDWRLSTVGSRQSTVTVVSPSRQLQSAFLSSVRLNSPRVGRTRGRESRRRSRPAPAPTRIHTEPNQRPTLSDRRRKECRVGGRV